MRQITKFYGPHAALAGVDLEVEAGQVVGLLGLNGAGKTTCLRLLSGQEAPTSGSILIGGRDLEAHGAQARADIGFLPQAPPLYPEMTVAGFLDFAAAIRPAQKLSPGRRRRRALVDGALAACDLTALADSRIGALSDGMRRRVGIAQAVVHEPEVVLLDEPTAGLDPVQVVHMRRLIQGLRGRHTVLVSSHVLEEVHLLCDLLWVLHEGAVVARGSEAELAARLSGAEELVVEVRGSQTQLAAALAALPGLGGWRPLAPAAAAGPDRPAHTSDEGSTSTWLLACERDVREEVARRLVGSGLGLCRLERRTLGLEGIFMALTRGPGT